MATFGQQFSNMALMGKLVSLCKRRGFVFQNSEIYSGLSGFWDYGPLGVQLARNIEKMWWNEIVSMRDNVVGLDSAQIGPEAVWTASGHVGAFNDALVDDKKSKERFRIDQLMYETQEDAEAAELYALTWLDEPKQDNDASPEETETQFWDGLKEKIGYYPKNPNNKKESRFTLPRQFNLMFKQTVGATGDSGQTAYLRAETCQPIFVDFDLVRESGRQKIPFGIAQIGKAFRNEINPRNFLFRAREFTQMEMEFFVRNDELSDALKKIDWGTEGYEDEPAPSASTMDWYDYWLEQRQAFYDKIGIPRDMLRLHPHPPEKLAHYARAACDIEFQFPFGWGELEGIHHRGNFDLTQHQEHAKKKLGVFDVEAQQALVAGGASKEEAKALASYIPSCIETSVGQGRMLLAILTSAYDEDVQETKHEGKADDIRVVLRLHPKLAPVKAAVLPLNKKVSGRGSIAYKMYRGLLEAGIEAEFDDAGSIGKRYRRHDEIGTPWCITYDFESVDDNAVTIRDRDSLEQERVSIDQVENYVSDRLK